MKEVNMKSIHATGVHDIIEKTKYQWLPGTEMSEHGARRISEQ